MNQQELENCLRKGFIDYKVDTGEHLSPSLITNNPQREEKVLDKILRQLILCDSFFFSVAFVTKSGVACLKDTLLDLASRPTPARGRIMVSQYLNFTEPGALEELLKFPNLELKMLPEDCAFHAKGYSFRMPKVQDRADNYTMLVGSSNLTANALTKNQEWNLFLTSTEDGDLIRQINVELENLWQQANIVNAELIKKYSEVYVKNYQEHKSFRPQQDIKPNSMQLDALAGIEKIRQEKEDRALIISATGTGKTYLSAFDAKKVNPNRFLFLVHRELIASTSKESFERVFCNPKETGILSGTHKDKDRKYLFSTVQTMSQEHIMQGFMPDYFDYIVVDEVHHAGADTYQKLFNYFRPKFWLGMTATPERTDDKDIFALFHHNIAYEIRLQQALEADLLVPFHYHGISEIELNGKLLDDDSTFNDLTCEERVKHILKFANLYGSDGERIKGLVFCSRREEAEKLATLFMTYGKKALALTGNNTEAEREDAIERLEKDGQSEDSLDYIFTVDIFNEGIDIPKVNQIIMLRPTKSAIIFVQQLGRGLRKAPHKRYIEVLDFIGNYKSNFLLPLALYGDRTYNKDNVRRLLTKNVLPGASSVHFDNITKKRIFAAIDRVNQLADYKELKASFKNMQYRLGRQPMMMDFIKQGDKDPYLFVEKKDSYYEYVQAVAPTPTTLHENQRAVLKFISIELAQGKRAEEIILLQKLLENASVSVDDFKSLIKQYYGYEVTSATITSVANVLALNFFIAAAQNKYKVALVKLENNIFTMTDAVKQFLTSQEFKTYYEDVLSYGRYAFETMYKGHEQDMVQGFVRYAKYSRKDVCRLLNLAHDDSSTLYGYQIKGNNCPIFVTYKKTEDIAKSTMYNDQFVTPQRFSWMTRSRVRLNSDQVRMINQSSTRKLLFVQKNAKQKDFYYLGDAKPWTAPSETTMIDDKGKVLPVVNFQFLLDKPVEEKLYAYINTKTSEDDEIVESKPQASGYPDVGEQGILFAAEPKN